MQRNYNFWFVTNLNTYICKLWIFVLIGPVTISEGCGGNMNQEDNFTLSADPSQPLGLLVEGYNPSLSDNITLYLGVALLSWEGAHALDLVEVNMTVETFRAACHFWNTTLGQWSEEGCRVSDGFSN